MINRIRTGITTYVGDLKRLTPNARKYLLGAFFIGMTFASFQLLFNLYLREKGYSEGFIGSVLSAGAIGMTLVSIPGAVLLSRVRLKPVLIISTLLFVIFSLLTIYTGIKELIWAAYFLTGAVMTFYRIAAAPFFMRNSSPTERPYLFSLSFGIAVVAGVFGSFIFGEMVEYFAGTIGYDMIGAHRLAMTVGVLFSLLALFSFGLIKMPARLEIEDRLELSFRPLAPLKGLIFKLALPYFVVGTGAGMIIPFLNLFFRDRFGREPDEIGLYFGLVNLTMFIGVMAGPVLVRKIGMVRTMVFTELASIPFMLILAFSYNFPLVFCAFLLRGALMNMGYPIGTNFAMEMVPRSLHALVNAILMFAWTSSWMISTQIGGYVIEKHGYTVSLVAAIILYILSAVVYYAAFHKAEKFTPDGVIIQTDFKMTG